MQSRNMVGKYSQFTFAGASIGVIAPKFKTRARPAHKAVLMEFKKQVAQRQPKLQVELGLMALDRTVEMFSLAPYPGRGAPWS
jgi:hypothetical protein